MDESSSSGSLRITGSDLTRRELMEVAAVTGAALVGGQLMPGTVPQAAAQAASAAPTPLDLVLRVNGTEHRLTLDPRTPPPQRLEERLRSRSMRRLHGADGRQAREVMPFARSSGGRARDHDHRGPRAGRSAPPAASRLHRA